MTSGLSHLNLMSELGNRGCSRDIEGLTATTDAAVPDERIIHVLAEVAVCCLLAPSTSESSERQFAQRAKYTLTVAIACCAIEKECCCS